MERRLDAAILKGLLEVDSFEGKSYAELQELVVAEPGITDYLPDGVVQVDPRNGERIVFNSKRARRPHDNRPAVSDTATAPAAKPCIICQGKTTRVLDVAPLSSGQTFINKNLFPIVFPDIPDEVDGAADPAAMATGTAGISSYGFHFLQWTSTEHDKDWHNMPLADRVVCLQRLAALEMALLYGTGEDPRFPDNGAWGDDEPTRGFVGIIKNYGRLVGGSLEHGHQQIAYTNVMPRRFVDNLRFLRERGETFGAYMLRENPASLTVADYGAARLVVPYFMRRPYDMQLVMTDQAKRYLYQLDEAELAAVGRGWHDAIRAMLHVMPAIGRETAYNVTTHNGPGAGLYFEFLPYTQETGGYEHLGLYLCQGLPAEVAERLRGFLEENPAVE